MRDAMTNLPNSYTLDETCANIATGAQRARNVGAAAIKAIAGYRIDQGQLASVVSSIPAAAHGEGEAE